MADEKNRFLDELSRRFGQLRRLPGSQSLYAVTDDSIRVYIRYSKVHNTLKTFYGLRSVDLHTLEGRQSFLCFLWNDQPEPLIVPYEDFEDVFQATSPASDGQYKALVYLQDEGFELYIAQAGKFNVSAYLGWESITRAIEPHSADLVPALSHT
ncbi:MAG: hypothetical protein HW388_669 [Dehalococcoidia bacterium]|nr:hypothetical protein [Dehalococcoidia bacterium]